MTPEVAEALRQAASAFLKAANAWQATDQDAFEQSTTQIREALGMSLDELAFEIFAFVEEARP